MKRYLYKNRYFIDDDPEFVGFFSAAVIDDDEPHHGPPYVMLELGDDNQRGFSWYLDLGKSRMEESLKRLKQFAASTRNLYLAALRSCKRVSDEDADQVDALIRKTREVADMLGKDILIVLQDRETGRGWTGVDCQSETSDGIRCARSALEALLKSQGWSG